jgi:hypothetical protein
VLRVGRAGAGLHVDDVVPASDQLVDDATADTDTVDADLVGLVLPLRRDDVAGGLRRRELRVVADDPCDRALTEADDGTVGSDAGDVDTEHPPRAGVGSALLCGEDVAGRNSTFSPISGKSPRTFDT